MYKIQKNLINDIEEVLAPKMSYYVLMMFVKNSIKREIVKNDNGQILVSLEKNNLEFFRRKCTSAYSKHSYFKVVKLDYTGLQEALRSEKTSQYTLVVLNKNKNGFNFIPKGNRSNRANMPRKKSNTQR